MSIESFIALIAGIASLYGIYRKFVPNQILIEMEPDKGTDSRSSGFAEPCIKITLTNKSKRSVEIRDVRIMFCRRFGFAIPKFPPGEREHERLPYRLGPRKQAAWYFSSEKLSQFLYNIYVKRSRRSLVDVKLRLRVRCETTDGRVYRGSYFRHSIDGHSHWP